VNGRHVPVVRANYAFQAVPVWAGASRVRLVYRPRGLAVGAALSGLALAVLAVLFVRGGGRAAGART
jgi:uncharacterized membrane protein YfhO